MGNTPSRILCRLLFGAVKSILNRFRSVFSTARTAKDSPPDAASNSDHNSNMVSHSQSQEAILQPNDNSIPADSLLPVVDPELTDPFASPKRPSERLSSLRSQNHTAAEQSHSDCSDDPHGGVFAYEVDNGFPEITITAFTETGQAESSIKVPEQRSYTSTRPVMPSSIADTPYAALGIPGLLDLFNSTLRTSHTLETPSLSSVFEDCIKNNYDFGTTFGRLRAVWSADNISTIQNELHRREAADQKMRQEPLVGNWIVNPSSLAPRRVWDLYAHRVVPWWSSGAFLRLESSQNFSGRMKSNVWPISHAWMHEKDRVNVQTPINGYEWPVPIPKDANLDLIRIEMLNLGAEYTWLDVLCLRQKGGTKDSEELREEEWTLDVPTIGSVYEENTVVIYLSGLGRPLSLKEGDLESDRCWFRRAWTLQEVGERRIIAGDMPDGPLHARPIDKDDTGILAEFRKQLRDIDAIHHMSGWQSFSPGMFGVLLEMQNRVSTNPVDKVAGLAIPLMSTRIPAYHESESLEDAWTALVNVTSLANRGELFFWYPEPGDAGKTWRPSWEQVMNKCLPANGISNMDVSRDGETDDDWYEGPCVDKGLVRGLAAGGAEKVPRRGKFFVKGSDGTEHALGIIAHHGYPIPEGTYTLVGMDLAALVRRPVQRPLIGERNPRPRTQYWVIGRRLSDGKFEKVSVFEMADEKEVGKLSALGVTEMRRNVLI